MPFYRYECEECATVFKVLERNGNDSPAACPRCESRKARRLLSRIGVIYKGNGYYTTDYRSNKEKTTAAQAEEQAN